MITSTSRDVYSSSFYSRGAFWAYEAAPGSKFWLISTQWTRLTGLEPTGGVGALLTLSWKEAYDTMSKLIIEHSMTHTFPRFTVSSHLKAPVPHNTLIKLMSLVVSC